MDVVGIEEHSYLDGVGTDVVKYGSDLSADDVSGNGMNGLYTEGVLYRNGCDSRGGIAAEGRDSFDVCLYSGSSTRIRSGYG